MAARGEIAPMPAAAIFADTQDEPASVYQWLDWLEKQLPFPVYRVTRGKLSEDALKIRTTKDGRSFTTTSIPYFSLSKNGKVGKIQHRTCTADYKIKPIMAKCREIIGREQMTAWRRGHAASLKLLTQWKRECRAARKQKLFPPFRPQDAWEDCQRHPIIIQWIGISTNEASRAKESREPWSLHRWPLFEARMSRHDCLIWIKKNGYPEPPRSACVFCPYHDDIEWRRLKDSEPAEFERALAFERACQQQKGLTDNFHSQLFLHRSCLPLSQVDFSTEEDHGQINLFNNECEGMCGA
jgi:hypothetical protein